MVRSTVYEQLKNLHRVYVTLFRVVRCTHANLQLPENKNISLKTVLLKVPRSSVFSLVRVSVW